MATKLEGNTQVVGSLSVTGSLTVTGGITGTERSGLTEDTLQPYPLELQSFRIWDAFQTALGTSSADDLGITAGAFATGCPYITTGDIKAAGAVTRYARTTFTLPPEYVSSGDVQIIISGGMLTTVADTSATVDVEAYKFANTTLKTGSDLVTTGAQSINSLTFADKTFVLTGTGLVAGDTLDIRIAIIANDAATGTNVTAAIADIEVLCDIKG